MYVQFTSCVYGEGNKINYSSCCKFSRLCQYLFGSQPYQCLQNCYNKKQSKTKHKLKMNKEMFCLVYQGLLLFFFIASLMNSFSIAVSWPLSVKWLYMSLTMSLLLKNAHKLYGFPQSVNIFVENSIINTCRSSRSQVFFKIGVLKNSKYSQEKTCVGVSFFIKFIKHRAFKFIKIESPTQVFPLNLRNF